MGDVVPFRSPPQSAPSVPVEPSPPVDIRRARLTLASAALLAGLSGHLAVGAALVGAALFTRSIWRWSTGE